MLARFFINRPVFASVVSIVIVLLGAVSYFKLPVAQYPDLAPPVVRVEAQYPGANASVIADTIAAPLEQEVNGVDRMIYMNSSSADGRYSLDVSFEPGMNVDDAAVLVQNRVNIAEPRLPEESRRLGITVRKQSTELVGVISMSSDDPSITDLELSNYLARNARDEVSRIKGIGGVNIVPAKDYGMRIWLEPAKLEGKRITVNDVTAAIREQNVQVAAGAIGRQPAPTGTQTELLITTLGRLTTEEQFRNIIIRRTDDGVGLIRLGEVARVELATRDFSTTAKFNNKPAAILVTYQLPGSNLVDVANQLKVFTENFDRRVKSDPEMKGKVSVRLFYDASMFIEASLEEVQKTLIEAFLLVALVVLVFLQSWRSTLIPIIAIPVALIGTFVVMAGLGFSVNMLTMFGLVLAIGIVVDDAIVVVENVERTLAENPGMPPREATAKAMGEIMGPIIAITLVLMCVFIPTAALPGITGTMYRQFALTIAASTFFSAVCALTLSPALCAILLKPHSHHGGGWFFTRWFNNTFDKTSHGYGRFSHVSAAAWYITLPLFILALVGTALLARIVPSGFVPDEDLGFVVVGIQLPDGASLERTNAAINEVDKALRDEKDPSKYLSGITNVVTLSGFSLLEGQGSKYANAWIVLDPWKDRAKTGQSVQKIIGQINGRLASRQEHTTLVFSLPSIRGLGNASGTDLRIQDRTAAGLAALQAQLEGFLADANQQRGVMQVAFSSFRAGGPQIYLDIDREKVKQLDVSLADVFSTLQTYLGSSYVNDFNLFNRTYQVVVQADAPYRLTTDNIKSIRVRSRSGNLVDMSTFTTIRDGFGPDRINRYNLYPSAQVIGIPAPGVSTGTALQVLDGVAARNIPESSGFGFEWSNMSFQEKAAAGTGTLAFGLGILLVYLILAAQYESWSAPLAVVLSVPLVVVGAMVALYVRGLDNNVFTQIGLVLLIGLGAKNAILIVEFARENRRHKGMSILDSAVEAARTRFRPILMTSFAFILGVVPLVIATGAGAASRQSLGTAVFGGMLGATVLGLLFTPAIFVMVQSMAERFGLEKRPEKPAESNVPVAQPVNH
jgi:HAE1 family hydrophobic/amphiphilic exporter-1